MARGGVVLVERCPTGIPGFDAISKGGFVRNSVNVVLGGPGAGKSTFLLQFLWNGVNMFDEPGVYVSFEPDIENIFLDALTFGWDFKDLDRSGKCKFVKFSPKTSIRDIKEELTALVAKHGIKRIALDPISVLTMSLGADKDIRGTIYELTSLLKRLNVTTLLADETVDGGTEEFSLGEEETRTQFMKFLSDGLINFYSSGLGGSSDRAVRITKMRRTNHLRGPIPFEITNSGIEVSAPSQRKK